jgi:hypothetical protein
VKVSCIDPAGKVMEQYLPDDLQPPNVIHLPDAYNGGFYRRRIGHVNSITNTVYYYGLGDGK